MPDASAAPPGGLRLFHKLFLVTLAIGLGPLLGLAAAMLDTNAEALRHSTRRLHLAIAGDAARTVRSKLTAAKAELLGIGQLLLGDGAASDDVRSSLVAAKVTSSEALDFAAVYAPDGRFFLSWKAKESAQVEAPRQLEGQLLQRLKPGELTPGEVRETPTGPVLPLYLSYQVGGEVRGIIGTFLDLGPLCATAQELGERLGGGGGVLVVDEKRTLVVAADQARVALRESLASYGIFSAISGNLGFRREIGASPEFKDGEREMLGALEPMSELGWAVIVFQPRDFAYHSLTVLRRSVLAAALVAALLAALGGFVLARRLAAPIAELEAETRKMSSRTFTAVEPSVSGRGDEIGALGRAFDRMAVELRTSEQKLVVETKATVTLSRYLSADVVTAILKDPDQLKLGGERREITVLFADVVAFTRLAEQQPPELVVQLLNELFTFATEIIQRRGGIIDKFIGDCVMAVWGAPYAHPDDPLRAVLAAEDLRRWLDTANRRWRRQLGLEVRLAMGINTGQAVAGNLGSEKRMDYTVIGDAVNIAARLESMAAPGQILISQTTRDRLPDGHVLKDLGEKQVYGKSNSTGVFEVAE